METSEVISRIQEALGDAASSADITVQGEDCNFMARVVSHTFSDLRAVQRQQKVLAGFSDVLVDGRLHALSVEAFTPEEWQARSQNTLTQLV